MIALPRPRLLGAVLALFALVATLVVGVTPNADASSDTIMDVLVSEDPVNWTPQLTGTRVVGIATANGVVAAGGLFTSARRPGGADVSYDNFVMFRNGSGNLLPAPSFDKEILAVEAAADGQSFYVAGKFKNVNGATNKGLVRVALDGSVISTFKANVDWAVNDIALVGDVLYVGGNFNRLNNTAREGLAAIDAQTGELLDWAPNLTDPYSTDRTTGARSVEKLDATPDGTRLLVIGNFSKVDGVARERVAMFDIMGPQITLSNWRAAGFDAACRATKWPMWIRDMDISPTGDFVVFGTTGAYGSPTSAQALCDTVSRFELHSTGTVQPTWRSYTGGDTTYGVAASDDVVYAGGHMRWMNNPYRGDREGAGAVDRVGITALDARTGVPLDWNPTRNPRGFGTYELLPTDEGLWVGQDTAYIGNEYHSLLALLPTQGGRAIARPAAGDTGAGVLRIQNASTVEQVRASGGGTNGAYTSVSFDPTKVVAATTVGNDLLVAFNDATLRLVADGGTGASTTLDLNGLISDGYFPVASLTSMFFDEQTSMLYYTRAGSTTLRARGYSPDSRIVEALETSISSSGDNLRWEDVRGAYLHAGKLYTGRSDRTLTSIGWTPSGPVAGSRTVVGGPSVDGVDYNVRALTGVGTGRTATNRGPVASLSVDCVGTTCWIDGGDSRDPDGHIASAVVTRDGTTVANATGAKINVPFEGTWTFTLTVTDDEGASASASATATTVAAPIASIGVSCTDLTCTFDGTGSTDGATPGAGIVSHSWDLGDGTTANTATVTHSYASSTTTIVTLTVTDDEGATMSTSVDVSVLEPIVGVTFLGSNGENRWTPQPTTTIPVEVRDGTLAILEVAANAPTTIGDVVNGVGTWTELGRVTSNGSQTVVWWSVLNEADAGKALSVDLNKGRKADIGIVLYAGVDITDPIAAVASLDETVEVADHVTPTVETTVESYVVNIWTDKTADSSSWTPAAGQVVRRSANGAGGGRIGVLISDADGTTPAGTIGGITATSGAVDKAATMWTIALRPA